MDYTDRLEHKGWYTLDEANKADGHYCKSPAEMVLIQLRDEVEATEKEHLVACDVLENTDVNDGAAVEFAQANVNDAYWKMYHAREAYNLAYEMAF